MIGTATKQEYKKAIKEIKEALVCYNDGLLLYSEYLQIKKNIKNNYNIVLL